MCLLESLKNFKNIWFYCIIQNSKVIFTMMQCSKVQLQTDNDTRSSLQYNIQLHKNDCVVLLYIDHEVKFTTYILAFKDQRRFFVMCLWLLVFKMITVYRDILVVVLFFSTFCDEWHIVYDQCSLSYENREDNSY